ncbi:DUF1211 domain-containing protein [Deinococcus detaillensis]|uniref:DUF1211 domain-containing protein n=1 Tax=Deinococcus detaillensis TaxID=2592048 RepID=A0A553UZI7_9DEIO|nr:TMEM175 family protein [Deinococcus detaillensis]TSA85634.1 DUF1211 domain-containing protein [Deinococcus detaillensis]
MSPDANTNPQDIPLGRLHGLSDGVFAIVMTLLVLELNVPGVARTLSQAAQSAAVNQTLLDLIGKVGIYILTFLVTGLSWLSHNRLFVYVKSADQRLGFLNVVHLMMVSLLPFTAALLGSYGNVAGGVWPYALNQLLMSLTYLLLLRYVRQHALAEAHAPIRMLAVRSVLNSAVFAVMGILAFIQPSIAWFAPVLLGIIQPLLTRWKPKN